MWLSGLRSDGESLLCAVNLTVYKYSYAIQYQSAAQIQLCYMILSQYSYAIQYIVNTIIQYRIDYMSVQYVDMVLSRCVVSMIMRYSIECIGVQSV